MKSVNPFDPTGQNLKLQSDDSAPVVAALVCCILIGLLIIGRLVWLGA